MLKNITNDMIDNLKEINDDFSNEDLKYLDDNYDLIFTFEYNNILLKDGIKALANRIRKDFCEIKNEKFNSFNTLDISEIKKISKTTINYNNNFVGLLKEKCYKTYSDFFKEIKRIDLRNFIERSNSYKVYKNHILIESTKVCIVDIFKIITGFLNNYKVLNELEEITGAKILESRYIRDLEKTLLNNLEVVENLEDYMKNNCFEHIKKDLIVLKQFYLLSLSNLSPITSKSSTPLVFFSTRHMGEIIGKSHTYCSNCINSFCILGFFEKISQKDIPKKVKDRNEKNKKEHYNSIGFYSYYSLDLNKINHIEDNIQLMINKQVKVDKITYNEAKRAFGKENANIVYQENMMKTRKIVKSRLENSNIDLFL